MERMFFDFIKSHVFKMKCLLLVVLSIGLAHCGKPSEEEQVEVNLVSSSPLIHKVARTVGTVTVQPNWFDISFNIKNGMQHNLRIEEISVYVTVDGVESGPHSFDLGSLTYTDTNGISHTYTFCNYTAGTGPIAFKACSDGTTDPSAAAPTAVSIDMFVDSLPVPVAGNTDNSAFPARLVLEGVMLDGTVETDRFEKQVYFTTR